MGDSAVYTTNTAVVPGAVIALVNTAWNLTTEEETFTVKARYRTEDLHGR